MEWDPEHCWPAETDMLIEWAINDNLLPQVIGIINSIRDKFS
jgi:hypothetical protein